MIHRFLDTFGNVYVPVVGGGVGAGQGLFAIPIGGDPGYIDLTSTHTVFVGAYWAKPCVTSDFQRFVCDEVTNNASVNNLVVVHVESNTSTIINTEPNGLGVDNPGVNAPMYPDLSPDDAYVIYRRHWPNTTSSGFAKEVRRCDIDGSNDQTLWDALADGVTGVVGNPLYSFDGSKIAVVVRTTGSDDDVWVMNADGSGASIIATRTPYAVPTAGRYGYSWANTSNVLAFVDGADVRTINADGSGDTVIYTDADPRFGVVGPTKWWSPDDSAIAYMQYNTGASNPKGTLGTIDAAGGGFSAFSPSFKIFGGALRFQPQVFRGRVWCQPFDATPTPQRDYILSVEFDGSDPREEAFWLWAGTDTYQGFFYETGL